MNPRARDRRLRELAAYFPDFVVSVDRERRYLWCNRYTRGLTPAEVVGSRIEDWVTPDSVPAMSEAIERCFATREATMYQAASFRDDGDPAEYECHALPWIDSEGRDCAIILTRDITEQRAAMRRLEASERRFAQAMSSGQIGVWEHDPRTKHTIRDAWIAAATGLPERDSGVDTWLSRIHPDDRVRMLAAYEAMLEGDSDAMEIDYRLCLPDGSTRWFLERVKRQLDADGKVALITGVMLDVTERRQVEAERQELARQLEQTQRLESIGELAGGVAHDFNNLLMVIQSAADSAAILSARGQSIVRELQQIHTAAERAAALTSKLLAFSRRSALEIHALDLAELVVEVTRLATRVLPKTVEIECRVPEREVVVSADRHQLEQVLLNLCINARDAMADGGQLRLALERTDTQAVLRVTDTGAGIPAAIRDRIFEPFFTTKPPGAGTGLGLAMAHGIIQQHRGTINVDSEVGRGTQICIRLPLSDERPSEAPHPPAPTEAATSAGARLLIADDEAMILELLQQLLLGAGYEVVTAVDGEDALAKWAEHDGEFDLVLLDVVMPRLDGWKTYERLRDLDPQMPVLFSSGYSASAIPREFTRPDAPALLSKPYDIKELLRAIEAALEAGA